jgi:hypothetical protein
VSLQPTDSGPAGVPMVVQESTRTPPFCPARRHLRPPGLPLAIRLARFFGQTVEEVFHVDGSS